MINRIFSNYVFSRISLIFLLTFLFVFNYSDVQWLVTSKKICTLLYSIYAILKLSYSFKNLNNFTKVISISLVAVSFISFLLTSRLELITDLLIFLSLISIFESDISLDKRFAKNCCFFAMIGIAFNIFFYREMYRISLGGLDPNYTAYILLLFACLAWKTTSKNSVAVLSCIPSVFTLSRALFMSFALVVMTTFKKPWNEKNTLQRTVIFIPFVLIACFTVWTTINPYEYEFFKFVDHKIIGNAYNIFGDSARLINVIRNNSDHYRHLANVNYLNYAFQSREALLAGVDLASYEKNVYMYAPHNMYLLLFLKSGILIGTIILLYFYKNLWMVVPRNSSILIGIAPFFGFLGVEIAAIYTLFLAFILKLEVSPIKNI